MVKTHERRSLGFFFHRIRSVMGHSSDSLTHNYARIAYIGKLDKEGLHYAKANMAPSFSLASVTISVYVLRLIESKVMFFMGLFYLNHQSEFGTY